VAVSALGAGAGDGAEPPFRLELAYALAFHLGDEEVAVCIDVHGERLVQLAANPRPGPGGGAGGEEGAPGLRAGGTGRQRPQGWRRARQREKARQRLEGVSWQFRCPLRFIFVRRPEPAGG